MFKPSRLALALIAGAVLSTPALADKGKAYLTVNGQPISQSVYNAFMNEQKAQGAADSAELQAMVKEELVRREILAQEAKKKGLDKNADIQGQMDLARQAILIRAYLSDYVKANPIGDDQLKANYEQFKSNLGNTEYKPRHILVEKQEEAQAIIDKLGKGEKFSELAKDSKDPGSKSKGGELNWSIPGTFVKPFADAMVGLKKGEYTKSPVQTQFGYHVILLDDTRSLTPPTFEQVKPQLQQRAGQQQIEALVRQLREKASVK